MDAISEFRIAVFGAALDFLESDWLTEQEVCESLKQCLEFFYRGDSPCSATVRDFCMTKIRRANNAKA